MIRKDFVTVHGIFKGIGEEWVEVPTKEEYDDFRQRVGSALDLADKKIISLEDRIAALEDRNSVPTTENVADWLHEAKEEYEESLDNEKTQMTIMNGKGDTLELEGTKKQIEAFEAERRKKNVALFPKALSFVKIVELALERGLTVKKVTTYKKEK